MNSKWHSIKAKYLLIKQSHPSSDLDGVVTAFRDGEVVLRSERRTEGFTEATEFIGYQGVKKGELVVHSMDAFAGAIGISKSDGRMSPVVHIYRGVDGVDLRYYAYYLKHLSNVGYIQSLSKGIRERSTSFDPAVLKELVLPVPPIEEQRRIANFLSIEIDKVDLIIGKNLELLSSLEKELNSLTSWVFQSVPNRIKFKYRFSAQSGNSISAQFIEENNLNNASGLPFIATKEVSNDGHINYDSDIKIPLNISHLFRLAKPGTVFLCSEGGSAGRKFAINEEVVAYGNKLFSISSKSFMSAQTLFHIFRTDNFQNQFALNMNGLIGGISSSALGEIEIPDISGDDEIILLQNLEKINGDYLVKRDKINRILELLREYKIALISNTVTGEFSFNRELGEII